MSQLDEAYAREAIQLVRTGSGFDAGEQMGVDNSRPIIFAAFANDRVEGTRYLRNLAEEARRIREALGLAAEICELEVRQNATVGEILDFLQHKRGRIAIFHYGGHADGFRLLLESASGHPEAADAGGFARFLGGLGLQLVFLNGCSTEPQVEALLQANVNAVVATTQAIEDEAAVEFASRFYKGLATGASISASFKEASSAIKTSWGGGRRNLVVELAGDAGPTTDRWPWIFRYPPGSETACEWNLPDAARDPLFGLPPLPTLDYPEEPFQYLNRFTRSQARDFFGRNSDVRALYRKVVDRLEAPIVLYYGQSGVGKSSLLDAGLLPRLEAVHEVRYLRRSRQGGLLDTLRLAFLPEVFDGLIADAWRTKEALTGRPLTVILDQVEEVFTRPSDDSQELGVLLQALTDLLLDPAARPEGKLILGFRKEWLPELDKALAEKRLPRTGVFLDRLDSRGVIEAVRLSAAVRAHYGLTVDAGLPESIANDLLSDRDSAVSPTLQVLMSTLWARARERSRSTPVFDESLYRDARRRGLHLDDFLNRQLSGVGVQEPSASHTGLVLDLLAFHTTDLGTAEQRTGPERRAAYAHVGALAERVVEACRTAYLLIDAAGDRADLQDSTRLAHDTLAPLVRRRFDESDLPGQRARRILTVRAADFDDGHDGEPLDAADLQTVEAGAAGTRAWDAVEQRIVALSRAARDRRRFWRKIAYGASVAAVAVITLTGLYASAVSVKLSGANSDLKKAVGERDQTNTQLKATIGQLDLANRSARENERLANRRAAGSMVAQANLLSAAGRSSQAQSLFARARDIYSQNGYSPIIADYGLWDLARRLPVKIAQLREFDKNSILERPQAAYLKDGRELIVGREGVVERLDLPTGTVSWQYRHPGFSDNLNSIVMLPTEVGG
jgi:hypothetical protein